jgi:hypothetical protein
MAAGRWRSVRRQTLTAAHTHPHHRPDAAARRLNNPAFITACPITAGKITSLRAFTVHGIPLRRIARGQLHGHPVAVLTGEDGHAVGVVVQMAAGLPVLLPALEKRGGKKSGPAANMTLQAGDLLSLLWRRKIRQMAVMTVHTTHIPYRYL